MKGMPEQKIKRIKIFRIIYLLASVILMVLNLVSNIPYYLNNFSDGTYVSDAGLHEKIGYFIGRHIFILFGLFLIFRVYRMNKKIKKIEHEQLLSTIESIGVEESK